MSNRAERTMRDVAGEHVWSDVEPESGVERERTLWVVGMTGGEDESEPWYWIHATDYRSLHRRDNHPGYVCDPTSPDCATHNYEWRDNGWSLGAFFYWMEGAPEWSDEASNNRSDFFQDKRTAYTFRWLPPEWIYSREGAWERIAYYNGSGESECPLCGPGTDYAAEHPEPDSKCVLCEGDGHLYIGEYTETVYRRVEDREPERGAAYTLTLTEEDVDTIAWSGARYAWSDALRGLVAGVNPLQEHEAWELMEAFEADTEGGHSPFPLLDPRSELAEKLQALWDSIV